MPSKTKKQHDFMEAIAHSDKFAKKVGVPVSVGKDFAEADKGRRFGTGGSPTITRGGKGMVNRQATRYGSILGEEKNVPNINLNKYAGKKEGGLMKKHDDEAQDKKLISKMIKQAEKKEPKKMAKGGETMGPRNMSKDVVKGSNKDIKFGQSAVQKKGLTRGKELGVRGKTVGIEDEKDVKSYSKATKMAKGGSVPKILKKETDSIEGSKNMKAWAKETKSMARGGGVESKGKTKGRMVTMCGGGKAMKK